MSIKAIETRYNGYRFRSRTEARWAVFFDAAGIRYEYEKEGYDLPTGKYLPDFWLPDVDDDGAWFEVKGGDPTFREINVMHELCATADVLGVIAHGGPEAQKLSVISRMHRDVESGRMCPLPKDGWDALSGRFTISAKLGPVVDCFGGECGVAIIPPLEDPHTFKDDFWAVRMKAAVYGDGARMEGDLLYRATSAAKSARFEHGDTARALAA